MKKMLFALVVFFSLFLYSEEYPIEFKFMKKVNNKLSYTDMIEIRNAINKYFYILEDYVGNENIEWVYILIANESRFNKNAKLKDKFGLNVGLMQVQKSTHDQICKKGVVKNCNWKNINDIDYNIHFGFLILRQKFKAVKKFKYNNYQELLYMALIAYNKGEYKLKEDIFIDKRRDFYNFRYIKSLKKFKKIIKML